MQKKAPPSSDLKTCGSNTDFQEERKKLVLRECFSKMGYTENILQIPSIKSRLKNWIKEVFRFILRWNKNCLKRLACLMQNNLELVSLYKKFL